MEKQLKLKNKILKALPKAVAAVSVTFQNPPFSPGRDHHKSKPVKGFSGPIVSMIPNEARRKPKDIGNNENYYQQDPTSPKISCMGQIKHKKKQIKKSKATKSNVTTTSKDREVKKRHVSAFHRMLFHEAKPKSAERRKSDASAVHVDDKDAILNRAPHVTQMKRFASGRGTFANFDWKAHVEQEEIDLDYSSDGERDAQEEEEDEVMIPFSAPILVGGGGVGYYGSELNLKPRKEINLWKRRTMAPPRPLQLDPVVN